MACDQILVVEDDALIRDTIKDLLELEGYQVCTAANGQEGLRCLEEINAPCLILLDLMMPVMNGWQFLEALENHPNSMIATIPVTVVSAAADATEVKRRHRVPVIKKPADIDVLLSAVETYCRCPR